MTDPADIRRVETPTKGRYVFQATGGPEAVLTYSRAGDGLIIIDHTAVPDAYRGQGVGAALVARAVSDARTEGKKILPLCPFASAQFRRHSDWADMISR